MKRIFSILLAFGLIFVEYPIKLANGFSEDSAVEQGNTDVRQLIQHVINAETIELRWNVQGRLSLTDKDREKIIAHLMSIEEREIAPFRGPMPKGGPLRVLLNLGSNERDGFIIDGDRILISGYQINAPDLCKFLYQRFQQWRSLFEME